MRYLIAVMFIVVMGSLLTRPPSKISDPSASTHIVPAVAESSGEGVTGMPAAEMNLDGAIRLQRSSDGHFYADVELNGTTVTMLVDTGASVIALSREDARKAGIATSIGMNDVVGRGADGSVHGEFVTIDRVALGEKSAEQMPAMVLNSGEQSLLGQSFLQKFASVEIRGDTMTLR